MLQHLSVQDIVLIERLTLEFGPGLWVLTGETGSGKSILLDALGLALGMRAESGMVRTGASQGMVVAEFDVTGNATVEALLESYGLPQEDTLMLRRVVTDNGKSRAFINDQPVGVAALKAIGEALVEVHGQHAQRGLLNTATHRDILDEYGELSPLVTEVGQAYNQWKALVRKRKEEEEKLAQALRDEEYLRHMSAELQALAPQSGEEEELLTRRRDLMDAEKLAGTLDDTQAALEGDGGSVTQSLVSAQRTLTRSTLPQAERFTPAVEALDRAALAVEEALVMVQGLRADVDFDAGELDRIEERLFALREAARKHQCQVDELPALEETFSTQVEVLEHSEEALRALMQQVEEAASVYRGIAGKLTVERRSAAIRLETAVLDELRPLKMENTRFSVAIDAAEDESGWTAQGGDWVSFLASANPGAPLAPLAKIASGGELSRFMLAMKVVLSEVKSTPSMIFDEVDTGIGGAVAGAVGNRLAALGKHVQVLVVTHLPQVAAFGSGHLRISKQVVGDMTVTSVEALDGEARREELARMLAGTEITHEARAAADRLLSAV